MKINRVRIKGTFIYGKLTGVGGTIENPLVEVTFKDNTVGFYPEDQLTTKSVKESFEDIVWSIFAKEGSLRNQVLFGSLSTLLGFIIGAIIFS